MHAAYGVGELGRGGVLDDEPGRTGLQRAAQVARPAERRDDQHLGVGGHAPDLGGRGDAVEPGHLDVEQGDVGVVLEDGRYDGVAAADLGDHLEVGLEAEQRGQRATDQRLVVGQQEPDGHARTTDSENPGESSRVTTVAPTSVGPLAQPVQPRAVAARRVGREAVVAHLGAGGGQPDLAVPGAGVPDHVGDALAHGPGEQLAQLGRYVVGRVGQVGFDLGGTQGDPRPDQLAGERDVAVALHRAAYVGERVAAEPLEVRDLGAGPVDVDVQKLLRELGLHRDHGERVAEDVVQVAGEPGALVVDGEAGVLELGVDEVDVAGHHRAQAEDRHGRGHDPERRADLAAPVLTGTEGDRPDDEGHRDRCGHPEREDHDARDADVDRAGHARLAHAGDGDRAQPDQRAEVGQRPAEWRGVDEPLAVGAGPHPERHVDGRERESARHAEHAAQFVAVRPALEERVEEEEEPDGGEQRTQPTRRAGGRHPRPRCDRLGLAHSQHASAPHRRSLRASRVQSTHLAALPALAGRASRASLRRLALHAL